MAFQGVDEPRRMRTVPVVFFVGYACGVVAGAFARPDGWWFVAFVSVWVLAVAYFLRRWRGRR